MSQIHRRRRSFKLRARLAKQRLQPSSLQILHGKNLDFEIFDLEYVSNHSKSSPTKKNFDQNFLT